MSQRVYGIYRATPPTLSDGQIHPVLLDQNGKVLIVQESGQPNALVTDAAGQDAIATTGYTTPARVTHNLLVSCEDFGAIISLNGATDTQNLMVNANYQEVFTGLAIPASTTIFAKNLVSGSNFVNLRIVAW